MVTGSEYIFENIDEVLKYVLETEQRQLIQDAKRKTPPAVFRTMPNMFLQLCTEEMARQAFVGQGSILISSKATEIGANTLIGAGSLVTKPVPDNVVAVGSPAKVIKQR